MQAQDLSLEELLKSYEKDTQFDQTFIVLTIGASIIATLGLLADSAAVVIGAMVVAPWILPLRTSVVAAMLMDSRLFLRSMRTLAGGAVLTILVSVTLSTIAAQSGLSQISQEALNRTEPTLLDLGIALIAGGIATYAKLRSDAVSALAGTAIAVALVPPVCVVGLMLSDQQWVFAGDAALLYLTNLLGILIGGLIVLRITAGSLFSKKLRRSGISLIAIALTGLLVAPLASEFRQLAQERLVDSKTERISAIISQSLNTKPEEIAEEEGGATLKKVTIQWERQDPLITAYVAANAKTVITKDDVVATETLLNEQLPPGQGRRFQLIVKRMAYQLIEG